MTTSTSTLIPGAVGSGKTFPRLPRSSAHLPEEERLMFLDWVLFAYPEDAGKAEQLPTSLLWEMYEGVAPGGEDWDAFMRLIHFICESESEASKAHQVRALIIDYGDSSEYTYLRPVTAFSKAVTSQHSLHGMLRGNLMHHPITSDFTYSDLTATVWFFAKHLMIVRDPDTKAALIQRIEACNNA